LRNPQSALRNPQWVAGEARAEASIIYKLLAQRRRDLDDVEGIFEARQAAGERLDWQFLDEWAAAWGITDRLDPYRVKYGSPR
jgi:hypothetical protein